MGITRDQRRTIFTRDNYTCQYCGWGPKTSADWTIPWGWGHKRTRTTLDIDHIWPRSKGGKDYLWNLVTACYWCNIKKGAKFWPIPCADCCNCGEKFTDLDPAGLTFDTFGVIYMCPRCEEEDREYLRLESAAEREVEEFDPIAVELRYYDDLIANGADMG